MNQRLANGLPWAFPVLLVAAAGLTQALAGQLPGNAGVPDDRALGTIELPRRAMANGEALPAGTYSLHLTSRTASPETTGALAERERWVEFRRGDMVAGREVASVVPAAEIGDVANSAPPATGTARVETLRGNEYLRVWINRNGTHYLIHLTVG